jgi:membrane fusion protein (multidrug efflux system)
VKTRTIASLLLAAIIVAGLGVWGAVWWQERRHFEVTDNAYVRGSITMIASRISGYVTEVPPPTHTHVFPGDLLAVFETEPVEAIVGERRAGVEVAEAAMAAAQAEVEAANAAGTAVAGHRATTEARKVAKQGEVRSAEARAASLEAERDHAAMDAERAETLYDARFISRSGLDDARTRLVRAEHDLQAARADVAKLRSELLVLDAEIAELDAEASERDANLSRANARHQSAVAALESAKAKLEAAELDLASTEIRAPIEGFIANQTVEPGFYIEEGWPMMAVVPLHSIWITANFKETQLERLRVGQEVRIEVDAFPDHPITGNILSFAPASAASFSLLPPQNASGNFVKVVQRVPVKIRFETPQALTNRIVPGMSVVVAVDTRTAPQGAALAERTP